MSKAVKQPSKANATPVQPGESRTGLSLGADASVGETAKCIAEFTAELSHLAQQARLDLLAYLLDMARLEASRIAQDREQA